MLLNVHIKNFGLIEQLVLEPHQGLNIITGETGAGKSIIVKALQVALGGRAVPNEQIRSGSDKIWLQVAFDITGNGNVVFLLEEQGIEAPEDEVLVMTREINRSGRSVCRLNGQMVTLSCYRELGKNLVDLQIQHEQQALLDQNRHRALLDCFGGTSVIQALKKVKDVYLHWKEKRNSFEELQQNNEDRMKRADLLRFVINEIEQVSPQMGEMEELLAERNVLANAEKIGQLTEESYSLVYEGQEGQAPVTDLLSRTMGLLRNLARLDNKTGYLYQSIENTFYQVEDVAMDLAVLKRNLEDNPQRLEIIEERLTLLKQLFNKYGATIPEVLKYLDQAKEELESLEDENNLAAGSAENLEKWAQAYWENAAFLSEQRLQVAERFEEQIARELKDLDMGRVECKVAFTKTAEIAPFGAEGVEFLISLNPGEPLRPLAKIASGGEISRIMLALKTLLAEADEVPVMIFDEVDAGVGGRALQSVAEKLARISGHHQILCITHAAQVASYGDVHFMVRKEFDGVRTVTKMDELGAEERVDELARMMGEKEITDISRRHAGQMLRVAAARPTKASIL